MYALLARPWSGVERFEPIDDRSDYKYANCFGTAVFCAGLERQLSAMLAQHEREIAWSLHWWPLHVSLPRDPARPGYVDEGAMERLLTSTPGITKVTDALPGDILVLHNHRFEHAGIIVGMQDEDAQVFHQREYQGIFEISTVRAYLEYRALPYELDNSVFRIGQ